mmetsp:Transcript_25547/g.84115  ORF Transcript_25547/g.84115 Transcript_25547/m.84115 type:complete len:263 (+) Transcript_25547:113-901(+)
MREQRKSIFLLSPRRATPLRARACPRSSPVHAAPGTSRAARPRPSPSAPAPRASPPPRRQPRAAPARGETGRRKRRPRPRRCRPPRRRPPAAAVAIAAAAAWERARARWRGMRKAASVSCIARRTPSEKCSSPGRSLVKDPRKKSIVGRITAPSPAAPSFATRARSAASMALVLRYPGMTTSLCRGSTCPERVSPSGVRKMACGMCCRHCGKMEAPRPEGKIQMWSAPPSRSNHGPCARSHSTTATYSSPVLCHVSSDFLCA